MELLNLLCSSPWLPAGCTPAVLLAKLTQPERGTLLLDDCDPVVARARNPVMLGLLNRGFTREQAYSIPGTAGGQATILAVDAFCPRAFAGMFPLPSSIDQFCIPINLEPMLRHQKPDVGHMTSSWSSGSTIIVNSFSHFRR